MNIKKIKTNEDYNAAIERMEAISDREDFQDSQELIDEFDLIGSLVALYEKENFKLNPGHPLEIIKLKMDTLGIKQKDLIPLIGSSGVISEVFNKKRGLSKDMIRALSEFLHIDQDILNLRYELVNKPKRLARTTLTTVTFPYLRSFEQQVSNFRTRVKTNGMVFNVNATCAI